MPKNGKSRSKRTNPPKGSRARLRGRGDYSADIVGESDMARRLEKKIDHLERSLVHATPSTNKAASMAGRALGSLVGQGDLGAFAGDSLSKLLGFGDYTATLKGNSLMAGVPATQVPKFQGDGKRGVRITEREFLGNVVAGTAVSGATVFTNSVYSLNPTDPKTFPWLSQVANLYDQWEPNGIVFEFHTTSSTFNGTSQALGAVIMATDYDPLDSPYTTKQEMENADYACSTVPSSSLLHGIECAPSERPLEVMFTTTRTGQENFSSLGNFQIATQGCSTSGVVLGEAWISYDITFYKKQLVSPTIDNRGINIIGNTAVGSPMLNSGREVFLQRDFVYEPSTGRFYFPPSQGSGDYLIYFWLAECQPNDMTGNATSSNLSQVSFYNPTVAAGAPNILCTTQRITAPGAWWNPGTKKISGGRACILITEVPPSLTVNGSPPLI